MERVLIFNSRASWDMVKHSVDGVVAGMGVGLQDRIVGMVEKKRHT
jgi:hypothetical protein